MVEYVAKESGIKVNGQTVLAVVNGLGAYKIMGKSILNSKGLANVEVDEWYSQQGWLDAFKEIDVKVGRATLLSIGKQIPETADWPPTVRTIEDALASIDIAYHINHMKNNKAMFDINTGVIQEGIGHYLFQKTGEGQGKVICDNPYPCEFDQGIIEATAEKFKPDSGKSITIRHDDVSCRKNGEDACIYHISW
jgi:hypothetical protein